MSKANDREGPPPPPLDLEARVKNIARALGMLWDGMGGAYREQPPSGRRVWRVYDQWGGVGGSAVLDETSEELISIEETPLERDVVAVSLPAKSVPDDLQLLAFAREQLEVVGWAIPVTMVVARGERDMEWTVQSVNDAEEIRISISGGRGHLHVTRISRP